MEKETVRLESQASQGAKRRRVHQSIQAVEQRRIAQAIKV